MMIGEIESFTLNKPAGGIINCNGVSYPFDLKAWRARVAPVTGTQVEFELKNDKVSKVKLHKIYAENMRPVKNRILAGLLGLILGGIGAHRIYLGFYGTAALQTALTFITGGFGLLWGFMEGVLILGSHIDKDAKGRELL